MSHNFKRKFHLFKKILRSSFIKLITAVFCYYLSPAKANITRFAYEFTSCLKPLFTLEEKQACDYDGDTYENNDRIGDPVFKFRHVFEVHSVPACDECERGKYRSNDSKKPHDTVLSYVEL